uniref:Integrator complex subunit 1 INTS2-binding domain-containing protein n=2 Tax=Arcella intermedia TaxID=1963864 RepID=A0A6B2L7I5_9EUKA
MEIMKRQGPEQAMQWLVPVLSHSEPDLIENLHIECLCELLFHSQSDESYSINRNYIPTTVLSVLKQYLEANENCAAFIINFFLTKLATKGPGAFTNKSSSVKSLTLLLNADTTEIENSNSSNVQENVLDLPKFDEVPPYSTEWLSQLCKLRWYVQIKPLIIDLLCSAIITETVPKMIQEYIVFIQKNDENDTVFQNLADVLGEKISSSQSLAKSLLKNPPIYSNIASLFLMNIDFLAKSKPSQEEGVVNVTLLWDTQVPPLTLPRESLSHLLSILSYDPPDTSTVDIHKKLVDKICPEQSTVVFPRALVNGIEVKTFLDLERAKTLCQTKNVNMLYQHYILFLP